MPTTHPRPWHRHSAFGDGARRPLDREQRAGFKFLIRAHRAAGRLTATAHDIAEVLLHRLGTDGQLDPSHDTIANDALCCARTVRRALARLRDLGLVRWTLRLVRAGWRIEQTSNQYELLAPTLQPRTGGQTGRETIFVKIKRVAAVEQEPAGDVAAARAALEARRRVVEGRMLVTIKAAEGQAR
jgi:hypothetical protein